MLNFDKTNPKKILEDVVHMAGGALGLLGSAKEQISNDLKSRAEDMVSRMDFAGNDDIVRLELLLNKLSEQQKDILTRLEKLENK